MVSRVICLVVGHYLTFKQKGSRTYGLCLRCGHTSPGWTYGRD